MDHPPKTRELPEVVIPPQANFWQYHYRIEDAYDDHYDYHDY